jgi:glycosyltransferase involved in cell wall biosynthesis
MKIIYLANIRLPTEKAHGVQIMNMANSFAKSGQKVCLVVPDRLNSTDENPFVFYNIKPNFEIKKFSCLNTVVFGPLGFLLQAVSFYFSSRKYILDSNADIIYSRDPLLLFFWSFSKKNLVWEAHTKKSDFLSRRVIKKLKLLVCISGGLKDHYIGMGASSEKTIVAHDAVDPGLFDGITADKKLLRKELNLPENKKIVSYVGKYKTMEMSKGVDELVEIFQKSFSQNNDLFFLFVGLNPDELSDFKKVCQKFGLEENSYKIILHIPQAVALKYLKASDIAVMNYPNTPHYAKYMSPLKMFEYMASGCAIVSTDLPSIREVLTSGTDSLLVPPGDKEAFVEALLSLSKNDLLVGKLSLAAYKLVYQKYTWDKRAENIISQIK